MSNPDGSTSVVEVEFTVSDPDYPFVCVSEEEDCRVELERMVPRGDDRHAEYFSVRDADPERVLQLAADHEPVEPTLLVRREEGGLFEFVVSDQCPARRLAELGAVPETVTGDGGRGRIVAEIPPKHDPGDVVASFLEEYPNADLAAKREREYCGNLFSEGVLQQPFDEELTERQREVLRTAFEAGYYDRPRRTDGEEVAAKLEINSATFSQHIRAAERKLVAYLFESDDEREND